MDRIGRYKIVRELGRGAMGVVYHAIDPNIGRPVAIKTIQLGGGRKPEEMERMRERLFREARSAGMLSHPGIVTVYDVGQEGEVAYIAMEFVDGPTLDQLLASDSIKASQMFSILGQTAAALDYAHQKGIVHRDIKPANIMLTREGIAKITDFGIAKVAASDQLTMTGSIVGTPHYMSPEQVQGQPVDGRSDQFSLAVIAYEILTGEKPYTGEHLTTVVYKIVAEEPPQARRLNPSLGGAIETALRKALAKRANGRYDTCSEFVNTLEKACAASPGWKTMARGGSLNEPTLADGARPSIPLPPARPARPVESTATAHRAARKSGFFPFLLAILMAAALLALIGYQTAPWLKQGGSQKQASGPPPPQPQQQAPPPAQPAPSNPAPVASAAPGADDKPSPLAPRKQEEAKQPVSPPDEKGGEKEDAPKVTRRVLNSIGAAQSIAVVSSPGGATATLDGRSETSCVTPCSLDAAPGRHNIAITLLGYQVEHRDVSVGTSPLELPAVILRAFGGTLMLSSTPTGAAVSVNGKRQDQVTPLQIALTPGTYTVTVEKDGHRSTRTVEIANGAIKVEKFILAQ